MASGKRWACSAPDVSGYWDGFHGTTEPCDPASLYSQRDPPAAPRTTLSLTSFWARSRWARHVAPGSRCGHWRRPATRSCCCLLPLFSCILGGWSPLLCCLTIELISRRNASARTNRTGRRRTERAGDTQRAGRSPGRSRGEASADHRSLAEDSAGGSSAGDQTSDGPVRRGQGHQSEERESTRCLPTSSCSASWPDPSR